NFVTDYPTSPRRNSAYLEAGNFYFETGRYVQALKWLEQSETHSLGAAEREKLNFQLGYSYFQSKKPTEAKKYFNRIQESRVYGPQAKYYLGYIAYEGEDYQEANQYFDQVTGDGRLSENVSYYQADMNFKMGNFDEAIRLGKEQYGKSNVLDKSEIAKFIGESYFNLGHYEACIPYLKEYRGVRGRWGNTDFYQLGYAYYMQKDYENAVSEFNK